MIHMISKYTLERDTNYFNYEAVLQAVHKPNDKPKYRQNAELGTSVAGENDHSVIARLLQSQSFAMSNTMSNAIFHCHLTHEKSFMVLIENLCFTKIET